MMQWLQTKLHDWQESVEIEATSNLFIRLINLMGLLIVVWMLPIADTVWGPEYFTILYHDFTGFEIVAAALRHPLVREYYWCFLLTYVCMALLAILGRSTITTRLVTWILLIQLYHGNYDVSNAGWHMLIQLNLLSVFLISAKKTKNSKTRSFINLLHNVAFRFIWIQVALIYFTSGVHKLFGYYWFSGEAMLIVLSRPEFSLPLLVQNLTVNSLWLKISTWLALGYQLSFPVLIWVKKIRPFLLASGFVFHLVILLALGITDFAMILAFSYSIFIRPNIADKVLSRISF